jgi:small subunit ribosomal protein S21
MLIVEVTKNIETALKVYKNKVMRTRQIQKLRERQEFVKPSVKKRDMILKAKYVQKIKNGLN